MLRRLPSLTHLDLWDNLISHIDAADSFTGVPQPDISWQKDSGKDFPAAGERRLHVTPRPTPTRSAT